MPGQRYTRYQRRFESTDSSGAFLQRYRRELELVAHGSWQRYRLPRLPADQTAASRANAADGRRSRPAAGGRHPNVVHAAILLAAALRDAVLDRVGAVEVPMM